MFLFFFQGARPLQRGGGANTRREIKNAPPIGHFPTAVEAATAVAYALQARDDFIQGLCIDPSTSHASPDCESFADVDVDALLVDLPASGVT